MRRINTGALRFEDDGVPLEISLRNVAPYGVDPGTGEAIVTCNRSLENAAPDARFAPLLKLKEALTKNEE